VNAPYTDSGYILSQNLGPLSYNVYCAESDYITCTMDKVHRSNTIYIPESQGNSFTV